MEGWRRKEKGEKRMEGTSQHPTESLPAGTTFLGRSRRGCGTQAVFVTRVLVQRTTFGCYSSWPRFRRLLSKAKAG